MTYFIEMARIEPEVEFGHILEHYLNLNGFTSPRQRWRYRESLKIRLLVTKYIYFWPP